MEYKTVKDLPASISEVLPKEAQELYLEQYKEAWDEYDKVVAGGLDQPGIAHRDAWAAVIEKYELDAQTGKWRLKTAIEADAKEAAGEHGKSFIDKIKDLF